MTPALPALLPAGAIETFAALLLGHVLADFVFQPGWMVRRKRNPFVLLLHVAVVFVATAAALGGVWQAALPVATAHLVIDAVKVYAVPARFRDGFAAFTADQAAHLVTLAAAAVLLPGAAGAGLFGDAASMLTAPALIVSGYVLAVPAGGFAVGMLTARFAPQPEHAGLPEAGRLIGQLERTLIFLFILIDAPAGIGFLIAAKSILRYDTDAQRESGEYVIIGTLASFTWALASGYATLAILEIAASMS